MLLLNNKASWREQRQKEYTLHLSRINKKNIFKKNKEKNRNNFFWSLFKKMLSFVFTKTFLKITGALVLIILIFAAATIVWLSRGLPNPNQLISRQVAQSTKIYDRTGETVLYEIHGNEKRTLINLSEIPDYVKWATISIEDKDFYHHSGFSIWAIFRTVVTNVLFGKKAGGSTLTQQFVKNAILTNEKSYKRKIKELILAYRIERKFSKDEILQMYLNEIPYGSTAYGIEAASQRYFGKSVKNVNIAEAAILSALPQSPSRYSPYGSNQEILFGRQKHIIDLMEEYGHISKEQADEARNAKVLFKEAAENIMAPHFVMYVKELLSDRYGETEVEQGGYKIITTLDLVKQKIAEDTIRDGAAKNEKKYGASNAALISLDPKTGEVLAMVGSKDYFNKEIDGQVNITTRPRQPGSSLKPIVYAASFIKGYTPNTILYDVVTNFSTDPAKKFEPKNYNGNENGPVSIKKALAGSLNVPAVKALYLTGLKNVVSLAKDMGYTTLEDVDRFGLSLVLGGGEVKLIEHANAYSAFARDGNINKVNPILKIIDKNGTVLEENIPAPQKAMDGNIARMVNDILSDNNARAYIFGSQNHLTLGNRPVAAKTGTTNDWRDAWTIGYTPSLVTGVWVGNNDNSAMKPGADGGVVAAPIWHDYMYKVLGDTPIEQFKKPEIPKTGKAILDGGNVGEKIVKIDKASGLLATDLTPPDQIEEKKYFDVHCILYYINKDDPLGPAPVNAYDDPQFTLWESRVLAWAAKKNMATSTPPSEKDNLHIKENIPVLNIVSPTNNETLTNSIISVVIEATAPRNVSRLDYFLDNKLLDSIAVAPFNLQKNISFINNGYHSLTVKACDDIENCAEQKIDINVLLENNQTNSQEIGLNWIQPGNNELASTSFPLVLKLNVSNPSQIAVLRAYFNIANKSVLINNFRTVNDLVEIVWKNAPASGSYQIYAEADGWNGQSAKSDNMNIIVKK
jgi:1A family penicillin-binding protein